MTDSVAIVGGGQSGASLAQALRTRGFSGPVHLICAEEVLPYERPPLSKEMLSAGGAPTWVLPAEYYVDNAVTTHLGRRVTAVDPAGSVYALRLDDGTVLTAGTVVLATGSSPRRLRVPGSADLTGVHTLGCVRDFEGLRADLVAARKVVIAGGGFIGSEVASGLRIQGVEVTVVDPEPSPLAAKTAPWAASRLEARHDRAGVRRLVGVVAELRGKEKVATVVTADGERLDCDAFLVAIGSQPVVELAASMGLDCADGVSCDDRGRTALPGVYAVGDVAAWEHPTLGRIRVEHYRTAIDHADAVAADIVGAQVPALRAPWFWTDQYEHRIEVAGRPALGDEVVRRPGPAGETALSLHLAGGRVVGVVGLDNPRDVRTASRFIDNNDAVDTVAAADPTIELRKAVLK
jgi:3-phenylpropionate/trans-cinnamate dioxygenase ferredoxin reductase subunit